ncbi:MAG: N-acetyltransferase [Meiothermus sp.]|nr:N-acetyltransferase [Meiothermus sp.]
METSPWSLRNNLESRRYEARKGSEVVAFAEYSLVANAVMFTHTEVDEKLEGQGIGSRLIRFALEDVRAKGQSTIPMCPFVAAFIQRHLDDYLELVHPAHRRIFGL